MICAPEFLFVATDFTLGSVFSLPNFGYSYNKERKSMQNNLKQSYYNSGDLIN